MTSKNPKDSIKRTGELLLSGWKLLNSACPVCNTALLSKGDNLRCPMCDLPVVTEANQANIAQTENLPAPPSKTPELQEIEDDYYNYASGEKSATPFKSLDEAKKEYDRQNKRMNDVSGKLGEKMIAGFVMLSTVCPQPDCRGTPLVRKGTSPMQCVSCEADYHISPLGDLVPIRQTTNASGANANGTSAAAIASPTPSQPAPTQPTPVQAPITPATTAPAAATGTASASQPNTTAPDSSFYLDMNNAPILSLSSFGRDPDDPTSRISKRLMQGWALLDRCCNSATCRGEVPLMRDLDGKEVCVGCSDPSFTSAKNSTATVPMAAKVTVGAKTTATGKRQGRARVASEDTDSSSSSENGRGAGQRKAPRGVAAVADSRSDDSFSDSEAEAELWAQYRKAREKESAPRATRDGMLQQQAQARGQGQGREVGHNKQAERQHQHQHQQQPAHRPVFASGAHSSPSQILEQKLLDAVAALEHCPLSASTSAGNIHRAGELADVIAKLGVALQTLRALDL